MTDARGYTADLDAKSAQLERLKAELQKDVESHKAALQEDVESYKDSLRLRTDFKVASFNATIGFAQAAIRGLVLINGGAAVALLTFLTRVWAPDDQASIQAARIANEALFWFVLGTASAVSCAGISYVAQTVFSRSVQKTDRWVGIPLQITGILLAVISLVAFYFGCMRAVGALGMP